MLAFSFPGLSIRPPVVCLRTPRITNTLLPTLLLIQPLKSMACKRRAKEIRLATHRLTVHFPLNSTLPE